MHTKNLIYALRTTGDAEVREQIETLYPADWEMEDIFRRSYQTYLQAAGLAAPIHQTRHKEVYRVVAAAACLLLTVGLGVGVWSRQQKIETRPSQESKPALQTETYTETTEQGTTELQTSAKQSETTVIVTTHTDLPVIVPQTTMLPTTGTTVQAVTTQTTPASTVLTSVSTTAVQSTTLHSAASANEPQSQKSDSTQTTIITEATTKTTAVSQTVPFEDLPQTTVTTEATAETTTVPQTAPIQLTGFRVEQYADYQKVICTDEFPEPDGKLQSYTLISDELVLLAASEPNNAERTYEVEFPEAGKVFTVTQKEYSEFVLTVAEGELINISINNVHGFFLLQDETCSLYWFRDGEGFYVSCDAADLQYLKEIARSFTPAGDNQ